MRGTGFDWDNKSVVVKHRNKQTKKARFISPPVASGWHVGKGPARLPIRGRKFAAVEAKENYCPPMQVSGPMAYRRKFIEFLNAAL
jgi:hypothetical protein